jgi:hypothetical protein
MRDIFSGIPIDDATHAVILQIHKAMSVLAEDGGVRTMWIKVPRGPIEAFGDYKEWRKAGEVRNCKEFSDWWLADFPEETAWFRVHAESYNGKDWVIVRDRGIYVLLMHDPATKEYERENLSDFAESLLRFVESEMAVVTTDVDAYNRYLAENMPYNRRHGRILRSTYNTLYPDAKTMVSDNHLAMLRELATNPDGWSAKDRIPVMTAREYLRIWRLAVEAMREESHDEAVLDDEYFRARHFENRSILDCDPNSPEAFAEWNSSRGRGGYRPYDLKYRSIQLFPRNDEQGWWFIVRADGLMLLDEMLRITYALWSAGIPVNLSSACKLVEIVDETDYVGIQPRWGGYYYNTVHDGEIGTYTSLGSWFDDDHSNHDAEIIAAALWEPVEIMKLQ